MNTKARWCYLQNEKYISFFSQRKKIILDIDAILYAIQDGCKMKHWFANPPFEIGLSLISPIL